FETLLTVQRAAAGSGEFYLETARAAVDLVGLDSGLVILRDGDLWEIVAQHHTTEHKGHEFSMRVLNQVLDQKRTYFQGFDQTAWQHSLVGVESVVASPIFSERQEVMGVVYGSRSLSARTARRGIQPLEAQVIQL
ncbi:MAG: family 3 adenylate cyclase, partial [Planctomycetes bacterium]|nr:family 3 adenylate cyclase [Planctomycetota bacterium]